MRLPVGLPIGLHVGLPIGLPMGVPIRGSENDWSAEDKLNFRKFFGIFFMVGNRAKLLQAHAFAFTRRRAIHSCVEGCI